MILRSVRILRAGICLALGTAAPAVAAEAVFSAQVAPLLVRRCGGCHVSGRKGGFQMASHEDLVRSGMVQPGNGSASRLVEVIVAGDMPRGGGRVTPAELAVLVRWIDAGAPCDVDPRSRLDRPSPRPATSVRPSPPPLAREPAAKPQRPGDVSFAGEVAPVLLATCCGCHGAERAAAGLRLDTFRGLESGGDSGPAVVAGRADESLLVRKLRGTAADGGRMPLRREPLPEATIALIARWIDQGARLDAASRDRPLRDLAAAARAARLDDGELAAVRRAAVLKLWERALPDEEPVVEERPRITVVANVQRSRVEQLADDAEEIDGLLRGSFADGQGRVLKGGVVLVAFRHGYDYSAFWQHAVGGERPKGLPGHAAADGDAVYAAVLVPPADDDGANVRLLIATQLAAAAAVGRGMPTWFAQGAGRATAMRLAPRASLAATWRAECPATVLQIGSAADVLDGRADPAAVATVAGGFVASLGLTPAKLRQIVALVDDGSDFEAAFQKTFRGPPGPLYDAWAATETRRAKAGR